MWSISNATFLPAFFLLNLSVFSVSSAAAAAEGEAGWCPPAHFTQCTNILGGGCPDARSVSTCCPADQRWGWETGSCYSCPEGSVDVTQLRSDWPGNQWWPSFSGSVGSGFCRCEGGGADIPYYHQFRSDSADEARCCPAGQHFAKVGVDLSEPLTRIVDPSCVSSCPPGEYFRDIPFLLPGAPDEYRGFMCRPCVGAEKARANFRHPGPQTSLDASDLWSFWDANRLSAPQKCECPFEEGARFYTPPPYDSNFFFPYRKMCLNTNCVQPEERFDWDPSVLRCRPFVQECSYHTDCPSGQRCEIDFAIDRSKVNTFDGKRKLFGVSESEPYNDLHTNQKFYGFCVPKVLDWQSYGSYSEFNTTRL